MKHFALLVALGLSWAVDTPRSKETGILEEVLPYPSDIRLSDDRSSLGMVPGLNPQGIDNFRGVTFPQSAGRVDSFDLFDSIIALLTADKSARSATPPPDKSRWLPRSVTSLGGGIGVAKPSIAQTPNPQQSSRNCPADVETLTARMLRDLPSYANRVTQRSRPVESNISSPLYVVVAGRPEFAPLTLGPGEYSSPLAAEVVEPPNQVFFTTLERRYTGGKAVESQSYHWLFLTRTDIGWRLAIMYSRYGSSQAGSTPTPPIESSNGIMGRAVSLWLRDCRAGVIRPLKN